jgi:hypothetical protein
MTGSGKGDAEKARYWHRTISEAARSGKSIRALCRQRRLPSTARASQSASGIALEEGRRRATLSSGSPRLEKTLAARQPLPQGSPKV